MREATERLIQRLAADAQPVRRLRPPMVRAALWLLIAAAMSATGILLFCDFEAFASRAQDPQLAIELAGTLLTGIAAVIAAFHLSLPDRSQAWALLPLPPLVTWITSSGLSCYRRWIDIGPDGWTLGEGAVCFRFIVGVSVPLGLSLFVVLRRARPLTPVRVAAVGGLGVAAIGAFVLQFFHPFDVTFMDLGTHVVAVGSVVVTASAMSSYSRHRADVGSSIRQAAKGGRE